MEIISTKEELQAVRLLAAKNDVRYCLNGVCFTHLHGTPVAVATDGHALGILRLAASAELDGEVIVPTDAIDLAIKAARKGEAIHIDREMIGSIKYTPIDGKFPDITRVIPKVISGTTAQFDPDLLARFKKVAKLLSGGYVTIGHNGQSAAHVYIGSDLFVGVCMPLRMDSPGNVPAWALEPIRDNQTADDGATIAETVEA